MKIIVLVAVLGFVLAGTLGPNDAVGAAVIMGPIILLAMLAIAIHEAWANQRGPLGYVVNIPAAIVGGFIASQFGEIILVLLLSLVSFQGSLASSQSPMKFVALAAMPAMMLFGSWGTLWLINLLRDRNRTVGPAVQG